MMDVLDQWMNRTVMAVALWNQEAEQYWKLVCEKSKQAYDLWAAMTPSEKAPKQGSSTAKKN